MADLVHPKYAAYLLLGAFVIARLFSVSIIVIVAHHQSTDLEEDEDTRCTTTERRRHRAGPATATATTQRPVVAASAFSQTIRSIVCVCVKGVWKARGTVHERCSLIGDVLLIAIWYIVYNCIFISFLFFSSLLSQSLACPSSFLTLHLY